MHFFVIHFLNTCGARSVRWHGGAARGTASKAEETLDAENPTGHECDPFPTGNARRKKSTANDEPYYTCKIPILEQVFHQLFSTRSKLDQPPPL